MKRRGERGSAALEGVLGMIFLLFLLLALVQLFVLTARQMFVDYAAFYGSKALSLGYAGEICRKGVKVAATGASGRDISQDLFRFFRVRLRFLLKAQAAL